MTPLPARALRTSAMWRNFPRYMIAVMLLVVAVNIRFIVLAVNSFPGTATDDDFDTSNRYDAILAQAARDHALGWSEQAGTLGAIPVLDLAFADGTHLAHAQITGSAARPLGQVPPSALTFREALPGHYVAASALPLPGQWDLHLQVKLDDRHVRLTRRVIVR